MNTYVAEFTKDAIFVYEFIGDAKRMLLAQLPVTTHNIREVPRFVEALNNGKEYDAEFD